MGAYVFDAGLGVNHIADSGTGGNTLQFNFSFAGSGLTLGIGSLKLSFANGDELHIDGFNPDDPITTCSIDTIHFNDQSFVEDGPVSNGDELLACGFVGDARMRWRTQSVFPSSKAANDGTTQAWRDAA